MKKQFTSILAIALCASASLAFAAKEADAPAAACDGLRVASGPKGKGYSKLFADIKKSCGDQVAVCEVNTSGGLDNLNAMSTKEADVGISQVDTWLTMKNGDENIANLKGVMGLNFNYLHVVVAANGYTVKGEKKWLGMKDGDTTNVTIQRFSELKGKTVALVGSAQLLGRQLDKQLNYGMNLIDVDTDAKAFEMVTKGQAAAALSVSGWPHGALRNLKQDSGLSLALFDAPTSAGQSVRPINYKGLGVYNNNALAVPNVLLTRPFQGGDKIAQVSALKSCIVGQLKALQDGNFEPGWNEIKDADNTYEIPKFVAPAAPAAAAAAAPAPARPAKK